MSTVGAVTAALFVLLVALSPTLLLGEPISAINLVLLGGSLLGVGVLVRWRGGSRVRTVGTSLAVIGAVVLALGLGLTALLLAGWGRGY